MRRKGVRPVGAKDLFCVFFATPILCSSYDCNDCKGVTLMAMEGQIYLPLEVTICS